MHTMYSVCNLRFFCYWFDSRNQNKNDFLKLGTNLGAKSIYGPNRESAQNIGTKSAFSPFFFFFFLKLHFTTLTYTLYYTLYPKLFECMFYTLFYNLCYMLHYDIKFTVKLDRNV